MYKLYLLVSLGLNICIAQGHLQENWGSEDGLTGPFYSFMQDSKNQLWTGSYSNGAYRYDGRKWTNYPPGSKNGPLAGHICEIFEDYQGGLWFHTCNVGFSRFYNNRWIYWYSDQNNIEVIWHTKNSDLFIINLSNLKENKLVKKFNFETQEFESVNHLIISNLLNEDKIISLDFIRGSNDYLITTVDNSINNYKYFVDNKLIKNWKVPLNISHFIWNHSMVDSSRNIILKPIFSGNNNVIRFNGNLVQSLEKPEYPLKFGSYFIKPRIGKYLGSNYSYLTKSIFSLWCIDETTNLSSHRYLLVEYNAESLKKINSVVFHSKNFDKTLHQINAFKDREGNYWISDQIEIIRIFPNQTIISNQFSALPSSTWAGIQSGDHHIWLASYGMGLWQFDGFNLRPAGKKFTKFTNFDDGAFADKNGNIYFNLEGSLLRNNRNHGGLLKILPNKESDFEILSPYTNGYIVGEDNNGNIIRGVQLKGLWALPPNKDGSDTLNWKKIDKRKGLVLDHIKCYLHDQYGRYWMGEPTKGVAMMEAKEDRLHQWLLKDNPEYPEVLSLDEDKSGNIWLGTRKGLFVLPPTPNIGMDWNIKNHITPIAQEYTGAKDIIYTCKIYHDTLLFFGNSRGAFILNLAQYRLGNIHVIPLDEGASKDKSGLMQNASFLDHLGNIWWLSKRGAHCFNPQFLPPYQPAPTVKIRSLIYGSDTILATKNKLSLPAGRYSIEIGYESSPVKSLSSDIRYQYRLLPIDTNWCELTHDETAHWNALSAGDYIFEIKAFKNGATSSVKNLHFEINYPLLSDPRFYVISFLIISLGAYLWFRNYKNSKDKEITIQKIQAEVANLAKEKNRLQVEAIASQLSPHFINNPLHWLSIRSESDRDVVSVVDKLSKNINHIFKLSSEGTPYHNLLQELEFCENYLLIEKTRNPELFDYTFPPREILEKFNKVNVPLMCVQIHVENAIERGIRKMIGRKGFVNIKISSLGEKCIINIEDNGIGRNNSKLIGNHGFQKGTRMITQLIEVYNTQNSNKITMNYEDDIFFDANNARFGTRVILTIPYDYNFTL